MHASNAFFHSPKIMHIDAEEMWALFEAGEFIVGTELTGHFEHPEEDPDVDSVIEEIKAAFAEERQERVKEANEPL
jgi:RIO kinase 1